VWDPAVLQLLLGQTSLVQILVNFAGPQNLEQLLKASEEVVKGCALSPLLCAVQNGHKDCVACLVKDSILVTDDTVMEDALEAAVDKGDLSILSILLSAVGSSLSLKFESELLLEKAVNKNDVAAVDLLIKHGADLSSVILQCKDETMKDFILQKAMKYNGSPSLHSLLKSVIDAENVKCLHYLLKGRFSAVFDLRRLDTELYPETGFLIAALDYDNSELVSALLQYDINVNKKNRYEDTPLSRMFLGFLEGFADEDIDSLQHLAMAKALIRYGCDVNDWIGDYFMEDIYTVLPPKKIAPFIKLLVVAGAKIQTIFDMVHACTPTEQMKKVLVNIYSQPRSLQSICRATVRESLSPNVPKKLEALKGMVSEVAMDYLLFPEMDDTESFKSLFIEEEDSGVVRDDDDDDNDDNSSDENSEMDHDSENSSSHYTLYSSDNDDDDGDGYGFCCIS
jgi:hypothetical protein